MLLGYKIKTKTDLNLLKGALKLNKTKHKPQTEVSYDVGPIFKKEKEHSLNNDSSSFVSCD